MQNIYFSTTQMWGCGADEIAACVDEYGYAGVELWAQQAESTKLDAFRLAVILSLKDRPVFVHAKSWDLNWGSLNSKIREQSVGEILSSIDLAKRIGASEVTVHPPRCSIGALEGLSWEYGRESLRKILDYAEDKNVRISLEILEKIPKEMVTSAGKYLSFTEGMRTNLSATLDMAHCEDLEEFRSCLGTVPSVSKIHISNKIGKRLHTPLDEGDYDFRVLIPKLLETNLPLVVEGLDTGAHHSMMARNNALLKECL